MISIYMLTSPSGKCYIGQTIHPKKRFKKHVSEWIRWRKRGGAFSKLYPAFDKYEPDQWNFEILCEVEDSLADFTETEFILKYDSIKNGYNTLLHSNTRRAVSHSKEHSQKIGMKRKTWLQTDEGVLFRQELSKRMKKEWKDGTRKPRLGPNPNISAGKKGKCSDKLRAALSKRRKPVTDGKKIWTGVNACIKELGIEPGKFYRMMKKDQLWYVTSS